MGGGVVMMMMVVDDNHIISFVLDLSCFMVLVLM
jgi:hypothetical protein